jgi:hypothetical protein
MADKKSVTRSGKDTRYSEQRVKYERLREPGVNWARPGYFAGDPTSRRGYAPANMSGVGAKKMPSPTGEETIDIRGYLGDERTGIRKTVPGARKPAAPKQQVVSNVTRERPSPTPASAPPPARMATNPVTGKTTGFTSGSKTGTTMTKAGKAFKTAESAYQRQQRMALEKMGVAGPRGGTSKTSSSAGGMRSTGGGSRSSGGGAVGSTSGTRGYGSGGNVGRGDVGAGRRGGGR